MTAPKPFTPWQATLPSVLPNCFRRRLTLDPDTGCWLWQGGKYRDGYAMSSANDRTGQGHRIAYLLVVGDIPAGLVLDHLCRVRHCVNPAHLEPVTPRENVLRGIGTGPVCTRGHARELVEGVGWRCKVCSREANKMKQRRYRAAAKAATA